MSSTNGHTHTSTANDSKRAPFWRKDSFDAVTAQPNNLPAFHPHSSSYAQPFDLASACYALRSGTDTNEDRERIQIKNFPLYLRSSLDRAIRHTSAPKGSMAAVALIDRGMAELSDNPAISSFEEIVDSVMWAPDLDRKDQLRLDAMIYRLDYHPETDGGVTFWAYSCTARFKSAVTTAARKVGVTPQVISTVALAYGLIDQPGVHEDFARSMEDTVADFLEALRVKTDEVSRRLLTCQGRANKRRSQPVGVPRDAH